LTRKENYYRNKWVYENSAKIFINRCRRYFGRGVDDGALERLLIAEAIVLQPVDEDQEERTDSNSLNYSDSAFSNAFLSPRKTNKYYENSDNYSKNKPRARSRLRSPSSERRLFGITDNSSDGGGGRVVDETLGFFLNLLKYLFLFISIRYTPIIRT